MNKLVILFIHGANCTKDSFNYIKTFFEGYEHKYLEYSVDKEFYPNLDRMLPHVHDDKEYFIVCHSLGGIYALHLQALKPNSVKGVVSIATPFGGCKSADILKFVFPKSTLLKEVGPMSRPIRTGKILEIACPWTAIITTRGIPSIVPSEPNDGIVSLSSMRSRSDMKKIEVDTGHFEVLLRKQTISIIYGAIESLNDE